MTNSVGDLFLPLGSPPRSHTSRDAQSQGESIKSPPSPKTPHHHPTLAQEDREREREAAQAFHLRPPNASYPFEANEDESANQSNPFPLKHLTQPSDPKMAEDESDEAEPGHSPKTLQPHPSTASAQRGRQS